MPGTTIIGQPSTAIPRTFIAPIIETAATWEDEWEFSPDLELVSAACHASSVSVDACEITRRDGNVKRPYETDFSVQPSLNLNGSWVRLSFLGDSGTMVQFVGQIQNQSRLLTGNDSLAGGVQSWIAYGGLRILQRMTISQAYFQDPPNKASNPGPTDENGNYQGVSLVDWIPAMNIRDSHNLLVGNRSQKAQPNGIYYYDGQAWLGNSQVWTHTQYVNYLINNFIQQYDEDGPTGPIWTLGGQITILDSMKTSIVFPESPNAAEMLRLLIPPRYGIDYRIKPTDQGFEINVFSLSSQEVVFSGATLPKNPQQSTLNKSSNPDFVEVHLADSDEKRVDRIEVKGKRIVVCGSLFGARMANQDDIIPDDPPGADEIASFVPKWGFNVQTFTDSTKVAKAPNIYDAPRSNLEAIYRTPDGDTIDPAVMDLARKQDFFREIYQHYGAPKDWDLSGGTWAIGCSDSGALTSPQSGAASGGTGAVSNNQFQTGIRETLSWIPLAEGWDYSVSPPVRWVDPGTFEEPVRPPLAFVYNEFPQTISPVPRWVQCDLAGMHVSHANQDWGLIIHGSPNHAVCLNHWTDAERGSTLKGTPFKYDYTTLVATLAIESDHRLMLAVELPDMLAAGDGSVMTVIDEEAQCWILLDGTAVGMEQESGNLQYSKSTTDVPWTELRNDIDRLALVMAGLQSKYINERVRSQITMKGLTPWADLVGTILAVTQTGDDIDTIGAVITSIQWRMLPSPTTIIKTGYA